MNRLCWTAKTSGAAASGTSSRGPARVTAASPATPVNATVTKLAVAEKHMTAMNFVAPQASPHPRTTRFVPYERSGELLGPDDPHSAMMCVKALCIGRGSDSV